MEFDPNDPSTWDERSKDNYDAEGNLKEVLMLSPTSYPEERFTKEGKSYYYTRRNEEGVVEPITGGSFGDTLKALTPLVNMVNPVMGLTNHLFKDRITEKKDSTDWSLKDLAYPLNVPFGGKRQGNLGDWTFATWALNQAPGQISAVGKAGQALKGKYFYKSPVKQPINVTPKDSTQTNIKDTPNKGIIPKYSSGAVVLTKDGPLYRPTERLASIFQMDADASLLKDAVNERVPPKSRIERFDETIHIDERNIKLEKLKQREERTGKKYPNERRAIMAEIGSHVKKWFQRSTPEVAELQPIFEAHYKTRSNLKTSLASKIKKILGVPETNTGHVVSLRGSPSLEGQKITPYTSQDIVGSDLTKYIEEARSNRRHGEYNLFLNVLLQQIDRPVNQMEEAVWFVNNRPDLTGWTMADEIAESIKMNRLALGLDTGDTLELRELLEADLKRAGLFENKADAKVLKVLLDKFYAEDLIKSAKDRTPGKDPWDVTKKGRLTPTEQRDIKFRKKTYKYTRLPSEATGE